MCCELVTKGDERILLFAKMRWVAHTILVFSISDKKRTYANRSAAMRIDTKPSEAFRNGICASGRDGALYKTVFTYYTT